MTQFLDPDVLDWMSSYVLPFEAELRIKLARVCKDSIDIDDVVQEVYCRMLKQGAESLLQIREPKAYVMQMAKNIVIDQLRHNTVVEIEAVANLEELEVEDPNPCPERVAMARAELKWVLGLISNLPDRCKQVFRARKVYGMSQNATAETLGLSENVVEKETMRGMAIIAESIARIGISHAAEAAAPKARKALTRKRHVRIAE